MCLLRCAGHDHADGSRWPHDLRCDPTCRLQEGRGWSGAVGEGDAGPRSDEGVAVVFRAKRADRVKIVVWDGSGLVLYWKRLEGSAFKWPPVVDGVMRMNAAQLSALLAGMDWTRMHAPRIPQPKALA